MSKSLTTKRKTKLSKPPKSIEKAKEDTSEDTSEGELSLSDDVQVDDDIISSSECDKSLNDNENNKQRKMSSQIIQKDRKKKAKLAKHEVNKKVSSSDSEEGSDSDVKHGMSDGASDIEDIDTHPDADSESDSDSDNLDIGAQPGVDSESDSDSNNQGIGAQPGVDIESDSDSDNQEDNHSKKRTVTSGSDDDDDDDDDEDDDTEMAAYNDEDDDTEMAANNDEDDDTEMAPINDEDDDTEMAGNEEDDDDDDDNDHDMEDEYTTSNYAEGAELGDIIANEYSELRKELADIPFEDLLKIKEKVGVKAFNKIMHGNMAEAPKEKTFKRDNKHRPRELSSKRPLPSLKHRIKTKKRTSRDPRFDDLSGEFKEYHFNKNYSFIQDIKESEKATVTKKMKKEKNDEKKQELKSLLGRMQQEQQVNAMKKKKMDLEKTYRAKERQLVMEGKTPYFLKKSDKKTLELAMKFKELKKEGRLDKYMSKKRKKVAQKQRKKMPSNSTN